MAVSFTRKTWADGPSGNTPITAADLNRHEQGITDVAAAVNAIKISYLTQAAYTALTTKDTTTLYVVTG